MIWMPLLSFVFMIYLFTMVLVASWVTVLLTNHNLVGFYCYYYYCGCKTLKYNTMKTNELLWISYEGLNNIWKSEFGSWAAVTWIFTR